MTLIPAAACLATVLSFNSACDNKNFEREKSFFWRSTCSASGETLRWYDAPPLFEDVKSLLFPFEEIVCETPTELVVVSRPIGGR